MKWILALAALLTVNVGVAAPPAHRFTVVDFEEFPHDGEMQGAGDLLITQGFVLRYSPAAGEPYPVGFTTVGPSWRYNGRSAAMIANSCGAQVEMTAIDNNPFDLQAIALAPVNGDGPVSIRFVGTDVNGQQRDVRIELDVARGWQMVRFPGFFNRLSRVVWYQGDCLQNKPHMFDDIVVRPAKH